MKHLKPQTALLTALLLTGCQATTHRFHFDPSPAEIKIQQEKDGPVRAHGLVSVIEGRRTDDDRILLRLRLRLENRSEEPLVLEQEKLRLVGSDLVAFGTPLVEPADESRLAAGETRSWDLIFEYPVGVSISAPEINGLNLSIALSWPGSGVDVTVPFKRIWPEGGYYPYGPYSYGYPYAYPYHYGWHVGIGYGAYCYY